MGILDRLRTALPRAGAGKAPRRQTNLVAHLLSGDDSLEVVGEAMHQEELWSICEGTVGDRIRHDVVAVLIPEPENPYDSNAIAVYVDGQGVGHLKRETARKYGPGLHALMERHGGYVALRGVIVGGGYHADGPGRLGVWLEHDPHDFGLSAPERSNPRGSTVSPVHAGGTMRTGFSDAWLSDIEDESYDLSWYDNLPDADVPAIARLRDLLAADPDPIDRHFQFAELEKRLYRSRDLYETALDDYDETCRHHDSEMDSICKAFTDKWGKIPFLDTYRQMAIRQQKLKDWDACLWWAERGLALYGDLPARDEAVEDLLKRRNRALAKLQQVK